MRALLCPLILGRRLRYPMCWRERQVRAMIWPLFARSLWSQTATVLADTIGVGAALAPARSVGVGSDSHCVGGHYSEGDAVTSVRSIGAGTASNCGDGHDWCWRCSGLCSLGLRGLSHPQWWRPRQVGAPPWPLFTRSAWAQPATVLRARQVKALLWPLFAWSEWAKPDTVLAGKTGESAALASVRSVGVVTFSHCGGGNDR
jgi:hypothetical protein